MGVRSADDVNYVRDLAGIGGKSSPISVNRQGREFAC